MTSGERASIVERVRSMSADEIENAIHFFSDAAVNGADEDYCEEQRSVYEGVRDERFIERHGPECVDLDLVRWDGDSAQLSLTDGSELAVEVREYDGEQRVAFESLLEAGIELHVGKAAECWVNAHADLLLALYQEHVLLERWSS